MATPLQNRNKILALAEQRIKLLYTDAYTRAMKIAEVRNALNAAENVNFNFRAFPRAEKELNKIMGELSISIEKMTESGLNAAHKDGLSVATQRILAITASAAAKDMAAEAANANRLSQAMGTKLANEKRGGLTLSERIWKTVQTSRNELEIIIQNNLIEGKGADVASREVRQYLNDPKKLFRRVKDKETGEYRLSKAAQQYHPGQGKYRSSYMNARRLMVTEMNMATQASECAAYADNPLIAGYEIRLSNNHTVKDPRHKGEVLPLHDICDELQGKYPPTFKFTGWHPHCRCSMIPILISAEERRKLAQARAEGKTYQPKGVITDVPDNFKAWVAQNQDRIMSAKTLPFFLQDNGEMTKDGYVIDEKFSETPMPNALKVAEQRHAERTPEQEQAIKQKWEEREAQLKEYSLLKKQSGNILNVAKDYVDADPAALEELLQKVNSKQIYNNDEMAALKAKMQATISQIQQQKAAEKAISDIIPDAHQWHKQFTMAELNQVHTAVKSKLKQLSTLSEENKLKGLQKEIKYVSDATYLKPHTLYPTWEVSKSAYSLEMQKTAEGWMLDSVRAGDIMNGSTASDYYASVVLENSAKNYLLQRSVLTAAQEKQAITNFKKYTKETPINPHTIWGGDIGGIWNAYAPERQKLASELNNVTADELSLITRFTHGMTFYNAYNLRGSSAFWKKKWADKMQYLSAKEIADCERIIKQYTYALNGITNKMKRYEGVVFRGVRDEGGGELITQFQNAWKSKSKTWINKAAASSSTDIKIANSFDNSGVNDLIMIIRNKSGAYIQPISHYKGEKEVLLIKDTKYKLLQAPYQHNGKWYVELEEI